MDIHQLQAFARVVREGSFSRAARTLDITQPTISARIAGLEADLGGPLFQRGGRRLALTARGEQFLPYARRALEVLDEGAEAVRAAGAGERGRVTFGIVQSLAGGFLADVVERFHAEHPHAELFVRSAQTDNIVEMLNDGLVRLGLIAWPFFGTDLQPLLHLREPLALVGPPGHPGPGDGAQTVADVARAAGAFWLVQWSPTITRLIGRLVEPAAPMIELPVGAVQQLLYRGRGVALLTRTLVADDLAAGRLIELAVTDLPPLARESALVHLGRAGSLARPASDLVAVLRAVAAAQGLLAPET